MKKAFLTLVLIGAAFLLKAQKNQPLFADSILKIKPAVPVVPKIASPFLQQPDIATTLKNMAAKNLFIAIEAKDRMPVAKLDGTSKMPLAKLNGYDNMPVANIDVIDSSSTNSTEDKPSARTPQ